MPTRARPILLLALFATLLLTASAGAATLNGHVMDAADNPLAGICVSTGGSAFEVTGDDGAYSLDVGSGGTFALEFTNACGGGNWGSATSPPVTLAPDQTTTLDIALAPGGVLRGHVTGGGQPLGGICVSTSEREVPSAKHFAVTGADGVYVLDGLPRGSYRVDFVDCDTGAWVATTSAARQVGSGTEVVVDAALQHTTTISGHVTGGGAPLEGVCVIADSGSPVGSPNTQTDADGNYTLSGVAPGAYRVGFFACGAGDWATTWLASRTIAAGEAVTADADLAAGASIAGRITDAAGRPLAGICVIAFRAGSNLSEGFDQTASDGTYALTGLTTGSYSVEAGDFCNQTQQWGDGRRATTAPATGVDLTLLPLGSSTPPLPVPTMPMPDLGSPPPPPVLFTRPSTPAPKPAGPQCVVPKLTSKTLVQARKILAAARCGTGKVTRSKSRKVKRGRVLKQTIRPGAALPAGTPIALVLSKGNPAR